MNDINVVLGSIRLVGTGAALSYTILRPNPEYDYYLAKFFYTETVFSTEHVGLYINRPDTDFYLIYNYQGYQTFQSPSELDFRYTEPYPLVVLTSTSTSPRGYTFMLTGRLIPKVTL